MNENILEKIEELLVKNDEAVLRRELLNLTHFEISKIINQIMRGKRKLFVLLPPEVQAEVVLLLNRKAKKTILHRMGNLTVARFLHFISHDSDAVDILQFLPHKRQEEICTLLQSFRRVSILKLLKYSSETAGGIMDYNFILADENLTFREIRKKMEQYEKDFQKIPAVIVQNEIKNLIGYLPFQKIIFGKHEEKIKKFARNITLIYESEDESELIKYLRTGEQVFGVVNGNNEIIGVIKIEDLAKISLREATENIYGFAGVAKEEDIFDSPATSIKMRSRWLLVNLLTAFLAAAVVSMFQDTISKFVLLAAYMPVVAGMGGNAGTQTLAVTVRAIALGDAAFKNSFYILKKEVLISLGNGFIIGVFASCAAILFSASYLLGVILFTALVINLVVAGFFGAFIPLLLKFFKIDPALAATVFVTTATDVFGFFVFLGLAKIFLV